jgi:cytochrome b subunit of formate dehydrogenase
VRLLYRIAIPLLIAFMLLHHLGDWLRKTLVLRFAPARKLAPALAAVRGGVPRDAAHFRMHRMERIQHGLLIVSFTVLVWSGFALRFSNQWWAQPILLWEGGQLRGVVHRMAGAVMIALAVVHVISLIVNPGLRNHWKALLPKWRDVREAFGQTLYNIGLRKTPPSVSAHSYVEKVEYWAVIWGTLIMAATGLMLWANTLMLTWAPRVALDLAAVIHFYEAVLATLAIVVWHFYMVIFDPVVYPVDPAWLTGYTVRDRSEGTDAD